MPTKIKSIKDEEVKKLLAEIDLKMLEEMAKELAGMTFYGPEVPDPTVRELYPNLTEKQLDYFMSKYTGDLTRGERKKKK
jgi:hypothetical protein